MVQAMINISEEANQVLNIVKAKHNLPDKSKAIEKVILEYGAEMLEPELRPEYIEKLRGLQKQKGTRFKSIVELRRHLEDA